MNCRVVRMDLRENKSTYALDPGFTTYWSRHGSTNKWRWAWSWVFRTRWLFIEWKQP